MRNAGRTGFRSRICAALLCVSLVFPSLSGPAFASTEDHHEPILTEVALSSGGHHHDAPDIDFADHCHPGLDCFFQAVVTAQPIPQPVWDVGRLTFTAHSRDQTGTPHGFDPPPPRILS